MKRELIIGVLVAACSGSFGFGFAQLLSANEVRGDVREHAVELRQINQEMKEERLRTDARIFELAALVRSVIEADKEKQKTLQDFIQLLRVQNELLQRQRQ